MNKDGTEVLVAVADNIGRLTLLLKLARNKPRLMITVPESVIIFRFSTLVIKGFTKTTKNINRSHDKENHNWIVPAPAQVSPYAIVPTKETSASWPCASSIFESEDV